MTTTKELRQTYIDKRKNMDAGAASAIGHETVIYALEIYAPMQAIDFLDEKIALNQENLEHHRQKTWDDAQIAKMVERIMKNRITLYRRAIAQIKLTPEYKAQKEALDGPSIPA